MVYEQIDFAYGGVELEL